MAVNTLRRSVLNPRTLFGRLLIYFRHQLVLPSRKVDFGDDELVCVEVIQSTATSSPQSPSASSTSQHQLTSLLPPAKKSPSAAAAATSTPRPSSGEGDDQDAKDDNCGPDNDAALDHPGSNASMSSSTYLCPIYCTQSRRNADTGKPTLVGYIKIPSELTEDAMIKTAAALVIREYE
jgi:hypothetical protein